MKYREIAMAIAIYLVVGLMFVMVIQGVSHIPAAALGAELLD